MKNIERVLLYFRGLEKDSGFLKLLGLRVFYHLVDTNKVSEKQMTQAADQTTLTRAKFLRNR